MAKIKDLFFVKQIKPRETYEWLLNIHYLKRIPSISVAFGLYCKNELVGILTIGKPASPSLCKGICGENYKKYVYELNRLCVKKGLPRNALSFFVGQSLKQLEKIFPEGLILVSYADTAWGHHGYIYQATNWLYTGKTKERTDIGTSNGKHSRHYDKSIDYSVNRKFRSAKHRYVTFIGNRKKQLMKELRYPILPYPKGENSYYEITNNDFVIIKLKDFKEALWQE